jgi:uncharacterized damage-inducible protein DinB
MTALDLLKRQYAYKAWADAKLWALLLNASAEQFTQHTGYALGSLQAQVLHVMGVEARWFARINGTPLPEPPKAEDFPTPQSAHVEWLKVQAANQAIFVGLHEADMRRIVHYDMPHRGGAKSDSVAEILAHVCNHATDHRAQILATLAALGLPTMEQDMMFFFWGMA